jgi:hypothetical protein
MEIGMMHETEAVTIIFEKVKARRRPRFARSDRDAIRVCKVTASEAVTEFDNETFFAKSVCVSHSGRVSWLRGARGSVVIGWLRP